MNNIVIRAATLEDSLIIYNLLAAEGHGQSIRHVESNISGYTVMLCDGQIVAVQYKTSGENSLKNSVAVHPGYPENIVAEAMNGLLNGIARHNATW